MTILLTQYHRVLGGSSPALWVRVDSPDIPSTLKYLTQCKDLDAVLITPDDGPTYISVCKKLYEGRVWWWPWHRGKPRLECLEIRELLPYLWALTDEVPNLSDYPIEIGPEVTYWGGGDL